jgi:hypothetical protein
VTAYSTSKDECYPNTISDALSLLSTFAKQGQDTPSVDAVVSYHESTKDVIQMMNPQYLKKRILKVIMTLSKQSTIMKQITQTVLPLTNMSWQQLFLKQQQKLRKNSSLGLALHNFKMWMMYSTRTNRTKYVVHTSLITVCMTITQLQLELAIHIMILN